VDKVFVVYIMANRKHGAIYTGVTLIRRRMSGRYAIFLFT
jgi:predicted GIY-YIG superfamily endonuclease|tara:strand:+ start:57 stop:176 length:120 start_codon:yes stop_codon:yes gene_type:complete